MRGEPSVRRADANAGHRGEMARPMQVRSGRQVSGQLSGRCEANGGRGTGAVGGAAATVASPQQGSVAEAFLMHMPTRTFARRAIVGASLAAALALPATALAATIDGTAGPDTLNGTASADTIHGRGGADTINGRGGPDDLFGNGGKDAIRGGGGADTISGGRGADTIDGNAGKDTINGGPGADVLNGNGGADTIAGDSGNDVIVSGGDNAADTISCGAGWDVVVAGSNDTVARRLRAHGDRRGLITGSQLEFPGRPPTGAGPFRRRPVSRSCGPSRPPRTATGAPTPGSSSRRWSSRPPAPGPRPGPRPRTRWRAAAGSSRRARGGTRPIRARRAS